ncbi:Cystathionine beta-synthase [Smittium mucronatum]|uniref:Cystathionine beta-synthase n=1 Tax=Smittium mucronatum TaxID=133383 RepID=A0A1R0H1U5_9FUNG|nr:Cystathionine beta-synthase [Smittium mucronatum]
MEPTNYLQNASTLTPAAQIKIGSPVQSLKESSEWDLNECFSAMANELLLGSNHQIDFLIVPVDTGNSISYLSRLLKAKIPNLKVLFFFFLSISRVEPVGSVLGKANPTQIHKTWRAQDYGNVYVPETLDMASVDIWIQVSDLEAFSMSRKLLTHGLQVGPSSGATIVAFNKLLDSIDHQPLSIPKFVCVFPDSAKFYTSTLLNDDFIFESELADNQLTSSLYSDLVLKCRGASVEDLQLSAAVSVFDNTPLQTVFNIMRERDFSHLPVTGPNRKLIGYVSRSDLEATISPTTESDLIRDHMNSFSQSPICPGNSNPYQIITPDTPLTDLATFFESFSVAFITDYNRKFCLGVATKQDLLNFIERR